MGHLHTCKLPDPYLVAFDQHGLVASREGYVPPKRPYSFEAMLADILAFAANMLVEQGRLSLWMPTANDEDQKLTIPSHPALELVSNCVQPFNKCKSSISCERCPC